MRWTLVLIIVPFGMWYKIMRRSTSIFQILLIVCEWSHPLESSFIPFFVKVQNDAGDKQNCFVFIFSHCRNMAAQNNLNSVRKQPREYQLQSYEKATKDNTIINLETGLGKTLIACLLIEEELKNVSTIQRLNKLIIFLAPQVLHFPHLFHCWMTPLTYHPISIGSFGRTTSSSHRA